MKEEKIKKGRFFLIKDGIVKLRVTRGNQTKEVRFLSAGLLQVLTLRAFLLSYNNFLVCRQCFNSLVT